MSRNNRKRPINLNNDVPVDPKQPRIDENDPAYQEKMGIQKCARFFKTLIHIAKTNKQYSNATIAEAVVDLVRDIVLNLAPVEDFVSKLQTVLHSQAQPALMPFLTNFIAGLRAAVANGEIEIDGLIEKEEAMEAESSGLIPSIDREEYWQCERSFSEKHLYSLKNGLHTDVVFVVGEEEKIIPAHRYMLMITCPVFERMLSEESNALFKPDMVEYDGKMVRKIRDPEVHPDVMHAFLCYLYSEGKIERLEGAFDKEKLFFAFSLQYVANKYLIKQLEDLLVSYLIKHLDIRTVIEIYEHALNIQCEKLIEECKNFFKKPGIEAAFKTKPFLNINLQTLKALLEYNELCIDEFTLYGQVLTWTKAECERNSIKPTPQNVRNTLGDAFFLIRFPAMKLEQFNEIASNKFFIDPGRLLTDQECLKIFSYLIKPDQDFDLAFRTSPRANTHKE